MPEFRDVEEAVAHLARVESLPFSMYGIGAAGHEIRVEVDRRSVHEARAWFDRHRSRLADGRGVPVAVVGRRGPCWTTGPVGGPHVRPTDIDLAALAGCTAQHAARSAGPEGGSGLLPLRGRIRAWADRGDARGQLRESAPVLDERRAQSTSPPARPACAVEGAGHCWLRVGIVGALACRDVAVRTSVAQPRRLLRARGAENRRRQSSSSVEAATSARSWGSAAPGIGWISW